MLLLHLRNVSREEHLMPTQEQLQAHYQRINPHGGITARCKMWLPPLLEGRVVLDVGCRRGRGVYQIADRTGKSGRAVGVDWRPSFIEDARAHAAENLDRSGLGPECMSFAVGYPEDLAAAGVEDGSVDVVVVNSVLELCFDPAAALAQICRVLKSGGELYHATFLADSPVDPAWRSEAVRQCNPLGVALTEGEMHDLCRKAGFGAVRQLGFEPVEPAERVDSLAGQTFDPGLRRFSQGVVRAFKVGAPAVADASQTARYLGVSADAEGAFTLSDEESFPVGEPVPVSAETAAILAGTRYASVFALGEQTSSR